MSGPTADAWDGEPGELRDALAAQFRRDAAPVARPEAEPATPAAHPLVSALSAGCGAGAEIPDLVEHRAVAGGVEVVTTVRGPGQAGARLLDIEINLGDLVLHTMRGGRFEVTYPPAAFSVRSRTIHPRVADPYPPRLSKVEFGSEHGCSSDAEVPVFLLSTLDGAHGLWFAVTWSGSWRARLTKQQHREAHRLVITGPGAELMVRDDEELTLPSVVVGAYDGDGWAAVRAHLRATAPRLVPPWVVYNTWFNENAAISADWLLANLDVARQAGVEVITLDGAWYETSGGGPEEFATVGIGTWTPDPVRFPDGLEPLARAVTSAGLRFGLWCEFERAHPDSAVGQAHPEWLVKAPGETIALLDLGQPGAREWAIGLLSSMVTRWSLGWLKVDLSTHDVAAYWGGDERAELAHIRGLYHVMDTIRERHPDLVIEGCASGGNRVDRAMLARCDTFWLSDQTHSPDLVRATVANARRLLPAQYCYLSVSPGLPTPVDAFPDGWLLGVMPGVFGLMDRLREWPAALRTQVAAHIERYKSIRHLLDGEPTQFGAASEVPFGDWEALELAGDAGAVLFAHRLLSAEPTHIFDGRRRWSVSIDEPGGACVHTQQAHDLGEQT